MKISSPHSPLLPSLSVSLTPITREHFTTLLFPFDAVGAAAARTSFLSPDDDDDDDDESVFA